MPNAFFVLAGHHLVFQGLTFEEFGNGKVTVPAAKPVPVWIHAGNHIEIINNIVKDSVGFGIFVNGRSQYITINHNQVFNVSKSGIYVAVENKNDYTNEKGEFVHVIADAKTLTPSNIIISDNLLHHIGYDYSGSAGISHCYTVGGLVSHNEIRDLPRAAIDNTANDAVIEYNKLYNLNLLTQDSAAIYDRGTWLRRGTIMRNNYIKDTHGYGKYRWWTADGPMKFNFGTVGVYFDDTASGGQAYNNAVINAPGDCLNNNGGRDNVYTNNICINCGSDQTVGQALLYDTGFSSGYWEAANNMESFGYDRELYYRTYPKLKELMEKIQYHLDHPDEPDTPENPDPRKPGNFIINDIVERNIFYFPNVGIGNTSPTPTIKCYKGHYLNTHQTINDNLFYTDKTARGFTKTFVVERSYPSLPTITTWDGWKSLGFDTRSLIADPLFEDPLIGADGHEDFKVKAESPALTLGFQQIDMKGLGIRPYGDISGDGAITVSDAELAVQEAAGLATLTADQAVRADVSDDGKLTLLDAALIAQRAVGLIAKFPVES